MAELKKDKSNSNSQFSRKSSQLASYICFAKVRYIIPRMSTTIYQMSTDLQSLFLSLRFSDNSRIVAVFTIQIHDKGQLNKLNNRATQVKQLTQSNSSRYQLIVIFLKHSLLLKLVCSMGFACLFYPRNPLSLMLPFFYQVDPYFVNCYMQQ